jgi:CheY-like chemotaxis protein
MTRPRCGHALIIDDDANARYLLKRRLRALGLRIDEAVNGEQGIARAVADPPSVIFLDVRMPGMDGFEVIRYLKTHPRTKGIPVAIHTSMHLADEQRASLMEDVAAIINKSHIGYDFGALVAQLGDAARVPIHG